jgi:ACS family tartrate transporter-like MFS transporter
LPEALTHEIGTATVTKVTWRLVPFLFLLYIVAYLDRINVGFAALQMQKQLAFSDAVYGLAAGMFFAGYVLFQVPSNLGLELVGARRWIALIMVVWGIISSSMIFVTTPRSFYTLRFLLGIAEAGFFPGVIFYLKNWVPAAARARALALFMTAGPIAGVVGGPISGTLMSIRRLGILSGWQWLFLMEGVPAICLGIVVLFYLADNPEKAAWLTPEQREWLVEILKSERQQSAMAGGIHVFAAFGNPNIWFLALVYLGLNICSYGISLWLPNVIHSLSGIGNRAIGILAAVPYVAAAITMVLAGAHSDRTGERRWHVAIPAMLGGTALALGAHSSSITVVIVAITLAVMGLTAMLGPFWAMPTAFLSGTAAAAGIALINSVGNLGGFFGPYIIGLVRTYTGTFRGGLLFTGAALALSGCVVLLVRVRGTR